MEFLDSCGGHCAPSVTYNFPWLLLASWCAFVCFYFVAVLWISGYEIGSEETCDGRTGKSCGLKVGLEDSHSSYVLMKMSFL